MCMHVYVSMWIYAMGAGAEEQKRASEARITAGAKSTVVGGEN